MNTVIRVNQIEAARNLNEGVDEAAGRAAAVKRTYTCPMHPEIRQAGPGRCPLCGMALIPKKAGQAARTDEKKKYDKHAGHKIPSFLAKFWIALALTIPILVYSELPEKLFGFKSPPNRRNCLKRLF